MALAVAALGTAVPVDAGAAIPNFELRKIEGLDGLELEDRFGLTFQASEHRVNVDDCEAYRGGRARVVIGVPGYSSAFKLGVAYTKPGSTCPDDSASFDQHGDGCVPVLLDETLDQTEWEVTVDLDTLIGDDCASNDEQTARFYVIVEDTLAIGTTDPTLDEVIEFDIDLKPPSPVTGLSLSSGDRRVSVDWTDDVNESSSTEYVVYWSTAPITDPESGGVERKSGIGSESYDIESGLTNGVTYYVRVAARDDADNESTLSDEQSVVPLETLDFWELYQASGGTDPGGYCFVATAAYGTPLAGELGALRAFRDRVLLPTSGGAAFVRAYYRWGRFAAAWIADKPALRAATRVALVPLVWLARVATTLPPLTALALAGLAVMLLVAGTRRLHDHLLRDLPREARR